MKILSWGKDGGKDSTVSGLWFIEVKRLFSIVLLRFDNGSRDAFHSHAFNAISWVLSGKLREENAWKTPKEYSPSLLPVLTYKDTFHRVESVGRTWVLSFRGPWAKTWKEYLPQESRFVTLTHGRKEL